MAPRSLPLLAALLLAPAAASAQSHPDFRALRDACSAVSGFDAGALSLGLLQPALGIALDAAHSSRSDPNADAFVDGFSTATVVEGSLFVTAAFEGAPAECAGLSNIRDDADLARKTERLLRSADLWTWLGPTLLGGVTLTALVIAQFDDDPLRRARLYGATAATAVTTLVGSLYPSRTARAARLYRHDPRVRTAVSLLPLPGGAGVSLVGWF